MTLFESWIESIPKEKLKRWEKESSHMYSGWVISVWLDGKEYHVDESKKDEILKMEGASIGRFYLY